MPGDPGDKRPRVLRREQGLKDLLGRGVRLGIAVSGLFDMQIRPIDQAAAEATPAGVAARPEIMIPLLRAAAELREVAAEITAVLDEEVDGRLIALAAAEGRAVRPDLQMGVCGEHAGYPDSVNFFHRAGLDCLSCSPVRVPEARREAGRAALSGPEGQ